MRKRAICLAAEWQSDDDTETDTSDAFILQSDVESAVERVLLEPSTPAAEDIVQAQAELTEVKQQRADPGKHIVWNKGYFTFGR